MPNWWQPNHQPASEIKYRFNHHPTLGDIISNRYGKVIFKIPKSRDINPNPWLSSGMFHPYLTTGPRRSPAAAEGDDPRVFFSWRGSVVQSPGEIHRSTGSNNMSGWWARATPSWKIWLRQLRDDETFPILTGKCQKWQPNHQPDVDLPLVV